MEVSSNGRQQCIFFRGDLDEKVYMTMPPEFWSSNSNKISRLRKSLYNLKQPPHQWFAKLSSKLLEYGFVHFYGDYSLFTYRKDNKFMALLAYVDHLVLTVNDPKLCASFKQYLNQCFHMKNLSLSNIFCVL